MGIGKIVDFVENEFPDLKKYTSKVKKGLKAKSVIGTAYYLFVEAVEAGYRFSARSQMLDEKHHLTQKLETILQMKGYGEYGASYAYFLSSDFDGAMKMIGGAGNGDLYLVEIVDTTLDLGHKKFYIFAERGISAGATRPDVVKQLGHLPKRGDKVNTADLDKFFRSVYPTIEEDVQTARRLKGTGAAKGSYRPMP